MPISIFWKKRREKKGLEWNSDSKIIVRCAEESGETGLVLEAGTEFCIIFDTSCINVSHEQRFPFVMIQATAEG